MLHKHALFDQLLDRALDRCLAERRAKRHDLTLGELADSIGYRPADRFDRRQLFIDQRHTILKVAVCSENRLQQILDKRRGIFRVLRPAALTLLQCIVVQALVLRDFALKGDVSADHVAGAIQQQRRQQAAHSAVAVVERMNTEKIVDEYGDQQERIDLLYSDEDKLAFVQQHMLQADIPFRETDTGFEAPECFVRQIRDIERSYRAPSVSVRAQLRDDIDRYLYQSGTFDEFLAQLEANGFAVKKGKYLSVRAPYCERFLRLKSLGIYYDEINLRRRFGAKVRFEERLQNEIRQKREAKAPSLCALLETRHYITVFAAGKLPLRRKHRELPFSWINDAELDKLLVLNKQLKNNRKLIR